MGSKAGILGLAAGFAAVSMAGQASAETRSYVVSWVTGASYNQDGDCGQGVNIEIDLQYARDLQLVGYTKEETDLLIKGPQGTKVRGISKGEAVAMRGRIDGKPVNAYTNPAAVPDPQLHAITSKYAYGFNLDGKGAASPNGFEDPDTHEKGVNNQMFRAMGCFQAFRGTDKTRPSQWAYSWDGLRPAMPAWLITLSGADLSKDGEATITFDRAREHITRDANGDVQRDMTFRIDPDPRSHITYPATIKDGVLTITQHGEFRNVMGELFMFPELRLQNTHLRMKLTEDGGLDGMLGGYQKWIHFYVLCSSGAFPFESSLGVDAPGLYHLLKKSADANPDPVTGENRDISAVYHVEAVPAFTVPSDETGIAKQAAR